MKTASESNLIPRFNPNGFSHDLMFLRTIGLATLLLVAFVAAKAADSTLLPVEQQVRDFTNAPQTTVVHFWATWCPNCRAELASQGWKQIIEANPDTHFVFVTLWSDDDGRATLAKYGIGEQKNFTLIAHPSHSRKKEDRVSAFMGQSIAWIPAAWVYKEGQMRYALNYGEIRFPILQQFIEDTSNKWER